jgi:class 3 adenylate cyclase
MSSAASLERRQLTVMLCDLVGWTSLSLKLDAEELTELVRTYRQRCGTIINAHGGTGTRVTIEMAFSEPTAPVPDER